MADGNMVVNYEICDAAKDGQWCSGIMSWYLHRLYCRISVWRSGVTLLYAPCIAAYGGVQFGGQAGSSDVSLYTVHFCLRWSQGQTVRQVVKSVSLYTVHLCIRFRQFLCTPCICAYGLGSFFVHRAFVHTV